MGRLLNIIWDFVSLTEVKRLCEEQIVLKHGHLFYRRGKPEGTSKNKEKCFFRSQISKKNWFDSFVQIKEWSTQHLNQITATKL